MNCFWCVRFYWQSKCSFALRSVEMCRIYQMFSIGYSTISIAAYPARAPGLMRSMHTFCFLWNCIRSLWRPVDVLCVCVCVCIFDYILVLYCQEIRVCHVVVISFCRRSMYRLHVSILSLVGQSSWFIFISYKWWSSHCLTILIFFFTENRYKHEAMVDGEPILFEILDTCPKVMYIN